MAMITADRDERFNESSDVSGCRIVAKSGHPKWLTILQIFRLLDEQTDLENYSKPTAHQMYSSTAPDLCKTGHWNSTDTQV
jgi:hypothetical protein